MTPTTYVSVGYHRHPRLRRTGQALVILACVAALMGAPVVGVRPVLAADATRPAPATTAVQPAGPTCGPMAVPAGHNPPRPVYLAMAGRFVAAGSSRWCTGAAGTGNSGYVWLVMDLDRTWVVRSDVCQRHHCTALLMLSVPTHPIRNPDGSECACAVTFTAKIPRAGAVTAQVVTSRLHIGRGDFAEAGGWGGDIRFGEAPDAWWSDSV